MVSSTKQFGTIQTTFKKIKDDIADLAEEKIEDRLEDIARYAVNVSPVDTGAYVTSFSIGRAGFGGGRSRTSANKPRNQNPEAMRQEGYAQLSSDIQSLDISEMVKTGRLGFTLRNRSPHAYAVENGGVNWTVTQPYHVFEKIRRNFG